MSIEFRNASLGALEGLTATAPSGAIIGVIGDKASGLTELMELAAGSAEPESGSATASGERRVFRLGDPLTIAPAEIIVLDHALATQDALVRVRAFTALDRLRRNGSTIFLASHEIQLLEQVCDEVWWIQDGRIASKGDPRETLDRYRRYIANQIREWGEKIPPRLAPSLRRGDGRAEVLSIETLGADGSPTIVWRSGEMVTVRATVRYHEAVERPVLGMLIRTQIGFEVYGTNTELESVDLGSRKSGETVTLTFSFLCDLCPNPYTITMASHDPDGTAHDWLEDAVAVTVADERYTAGVANLRAKIAIEEMPDEIPQTEVTGR